MPESLKKYRPANYGWIAEEQQRIGEQQFWLIVDAMHQLLQRLPVGSHFDIARRTRPENHRLVLAICCEWITTVPGYDIDERYTTVTRYK